MQSNISRLPGARTASHGQLGSRPASREAGKAAGLSHIHQLKAQARPCRREAASARYQQAAAKVIGSENLRALHRHSLRNHSEEERQGRSTPVRASTCEREGGFVGSRRPPSHSASSATMRASPADSEPESSASKDASKDSSNKLAGSASHKVDAESRVHAWQQQSGVDVDHRPPWGTFVKGVGLVVLWIQEFISAPKKSISALGQSVRAPFAVLGDLTYPDPRDILRLTCIVLAATAILTALVWGMNRVFTALLLPPVARRIFRGALRENPGLQGSELAKTLG